MVSHRNISVNRDITMFNTIHRIILIFLLIAIFGFKDKDFFLRNCKTEKLFEIRAGKSILKVSANGGRIISFKLGENEFITNIKEHENFGSTLWTAPQSDWGWPPYTVLDSKEYETNIIGNKLKMVSKPDTLSGLQFEKTFTVARNHYIQIKYQIRNISKSPKGVGAWEVTRVPCGGVVFFPWGGSEKLPQSSLTDYIQKENINWISINKTPLQNHQKLFSTASEGWLAYVLNRTLFIKKFEDIKYAQYSPNQGEVEIYVDKDKSYAELENQGSYQLLQPSKTISYTVSWYLVPIPKSINLTIGSDQLISFCKNKIKNINCNETSSY